MILRFNLSCFEVTEIAASRQAAGDGVRPQVDVVRFGKIQERPSTPEFRSEFHWRYFVHSRGFMGLVSKS
jgi:hypothetical protein